MCIPIKPVHVILAPDPTFFVCGPSAERYLSASAPLRCDRSLHHRILVRQWPIGGCDTHDTEVS